MTSKDIKKYRKKLEEIETGNKAKIERIKELLDSGTYKVSSKELADVILNEMNQQRDKGED